MVSDFPFFSRILWSITQKRMISGINLHNKDEPLKLA